jgi:hypothetical protein
MQPLNKRPPSLISDHAWSSPKPFYNDFNPFIKSLFNKICDEGENIAIKEIETVTQIISDLFLIPKHH